jgi:regulator of protease activity HflC (stomatin/prohibitin superfamily)
MKKYLYLFLFINLAISGNAYAEIYKRVDADGRVTYSNVKTKGATRLELDPDANTISNDRPKAIANKRTPTPEGFPKVDKQTQNQRDDKRKDILQSELEAEKAALAQAKQAYAEGESKPEVYQKKNANGTTSTFRNVPKFEEKMKGLQAEVDNHQKNVELLQKELDSLN